MHESFNLLVNGRKTCACMSPYNYNLHVLTQQSLIHTVVSNTLKLGHKPDGLRKSSKNQGNSTATLYDEWRLPT